MKIFGFGDSFITDSGLDYSYTSILKNHFNAECQWHGREGSGSWDAFFHFLDRRARRSQVRKEMPLYDPAHA